MLARTKAKLANEAAKWRHHGLIDDALAQQLAQRYDAQDGAGRLLLKWLGAFGLLMLGGSLLGGVGLLLGHASLVLPALLSAAVAIGLWRGGVWLARDPRRRMPLLGALLITLALQALYAALVLTFVAVDPDSVWSWSVLLTFVVAAAALAVAYQERLRWPLLLGLWLLFEAIGSSHGYLGHGGYFLGIRDERLMAVVGAACAALGVWHESALERGRLRRHVGFGSLYIVFGLLYCNLSLWMLSLHGGLGWVLAFTAAGIAQLLFGALLKDGRFTGFAVVFLAIDLYTRFFEHFWDRLSAGTFLALSGLLALGLGFVFERSAKKEATL